MNLDHLCEAYYSGERITPLQIDFSNFIHYIGCPRYWLYKNLLGLAIPDMQKSIDLIMGSAIHAGLEGGFLALQEDPNLAMSPNVLAQIAIEHFRASWKEKGGEDFEEDKIFPKTPANAEELLQNYWKHYQQALIEQEVIAVEMPFSIPLQAGLPLLYGTTDLVTEDASDIIVSEHKTTRSFSKKWQRLWMNSLQVECYSFAGRAYFNRKPAVCVDGLLFSKVAAKEYYKRLWFQKSDVLMTRALGELAARMAQLHIDTATLIEQYVNNAPIETAFARNVNQCHVFRECQYYDICPTDVKPSRWQHRAPAGWIHQHQGVYTQEQMMEKGGDMDAEKGQCEVDAEGSP